MALPGPPAPTRQPDPTPPSALHSGAWGKTKLGEGLRRGLPPATCLLLTAQVLTCKDGHVRLGGVKGASSLPAQLLTLLLQRSDLEAEGAGSWTPWGLGVWSHSPLPVSSCFLPSPLLATPIPPPLLVCPHQTDCPLGLPSHARPDCTPLPSSYPIAAACGAERIGSTGKECPRAPGDQHTNVVVALVLENTELQVSATVPGTGQGSVTGSKATPPGPVRAMVGNTPTKLLLALWPQAGSLASCRSPTFL